MTLKPALTVEEWKHALGVLRASASPTIAAAVCIERVGIDDAHSLAALCLHEQPFGFTREMAEAIRALVQRLGVADPDLGHVFTVGKALEAADRIEALLPPRDV